MKSTSPRIGGWLFGKINEDKQKKCGTLHYRIWMCLLSFVFLSLLRFTYHFHWAHSNSFVGWTPNVNVAIGKGYRIHCCLQSFCLLKYGLSLTNGIDVSHTSQSPCPLSTHQNTFPIKILSPGPRIPCSYTPLRRPHQNH
ncbi:hypothetical protein BD410DRAFT_282657 [Rickenella mellea]|uniref:Uncharacterized protein n=1 Tax=Rickenella mellea TaxID=50990 RepID=A0A4Y7Q3Y3_9AGAM|nr:hypothetical protein BD410DRAFT_282657 [Rickenella mellea]